MEPPEKGVAAKPRGFPTPQTTPKSSPLSPPATSPTAYPPMETSKS
ncbi:MAG: hypothetical protein LBU27_03805 [Candidatus Peribacteria bacterium]|nr:hypothetical protein [Candidatus Peribacteria bacterium]